MEGFSEGFKLVPVRLASDREVDPRHWRRMPGRDLAESAGAFLGLVATTAGEGRNGIHGLL